MFKRLALLMSILLMAASLQAQSVDVCFGLSTENCAIIGNASTRTLTGLQSFSHTFTLNASLTGLEALDLGTDFTLHVTGEGSFSRKSANTDYPFTLELHLDAALESATVQMGTLYLKVIDGTLYQEFPPDSGSWRGLTLQDALTSPQFAALAALNLAGLPLASPDLSATASTSGAGSMDALSDLVNIPGFITYTRLEDREQAGLILYPFRLQLDFVPLFQSSAFQQTLDEGLKIAGQLNPETQNLALIAPLLLQSSTLNVALTQFVAPSDGYIHGLTLEIAGTMDLNPLMGTSGADMLDPIRLQVQFAVWLDELDQMPPVAAPAEFTPLNLEDLGIH